MMSTSISLSRLFMTLLRLLSLKPILSQGYVWTPAHHFVTLFPDSDYSPFSYLTADTHFHCGQNSIGKLLFWTALISPRPETLPFETHEILSLNF